MGAQRMSKSEERKWRQATDELRALWNVWNVEVLMDHEFRDDGIYVRVIGVSNDDDPERSNPSPIVGEWVHEENNDSLESSRRALASFRGAIAKRQFDVHRN